MTNEELEELNLDDVFGNPDLKPNDPNHPTQGTAPVETNPPAPQTTEGPFLKTSTGTVYKSAEDAVQGIEHKDALISKLRQEAIERTGVDPVTGQPVRKAEPVVNYTQDRKRYLDDLSSAAQKQDAEGYAKVQEKLVNDVFAPYAPIFATIAKNQAIDAVATDIPTIRNFVGSKDFSEAASRHPLLQDAITQCENDPRRSAELAQFYRMVFDISQSRKLSEIVQAQTAPVTQTRPTVSSTSVPPPSGRTQTHSPGFNSSDERKALIEQQERAGVMNLRF